MKQYLETDPHYQTPELSDKKLEYQPNQDFTTQNQACNKTKLKSSRPKSVTRNRKSHPIQEKVLSIQSRKIDI